MDIASQIVELEKSLFRNDVRSSVCELKSRLAPEFKEITSAGVVIDLQDVLERLPKENGWEAKGQDFEFSFSAVSPRAVFLYPVVFVFNDSLPTEVF